jgi:hypothetical protein
MLQVQIIFPIGINKIGLLLFDFGDKMLNYIKLTYQEFKSDQLDASAMEFLHIDIGLPIICQSTSTSRQSKKSVTRTLVANEWNSFDIPLSTSQGLPLNNVGQFMFVGTPSAKTVLITFIL